MALVADPGPEIGAVPQCGSGSGFMVPVQSSGHHLGQITAAFFFAFVVVSEPCAEDRRDWRHWRSAPRYLFSGAILAETKELPVAEFHGHRARFWPVRLLRQVQRASSRRLDPVRQPPANAREAVEPTRFPTGRPFAVRRLPFVTGGLEPSGPFFAASSRNCAGRRSPASPNHSS